MGSNNSATEIFVIEANELLTTMEDILLKIEQGESDSDHINSIFRAAHTLKGAAGMFNYHELSGFAHKVEDLLSLLREGKVSISNDKTALLLECVDCLRGLLEQSIKGDIAEVTKENKQRLIDELTTSFAAGKSVQPEVPDKSKSEKEQKKAKEVKEKKEAKNTENKQLENELKQPENQQLIGESEQQKTKSKKLSETEIEQQQAELLQKKPAKKSDTLSADNSSLTEIFIIEGNEILDGMEESLLKIEQSGQGQESVDNIFRLSHTLKGAAGMFNYTELSNFADEIKVFFAIINKAKVTIDKSQLSILLDGVDCMRVLLKESVANSVSKETIGRKKQLILKLTTKDVKKNDNIDNNIERDKVVQLEKKQLIGDPEVTDNIGETAKSSDKPKQLSELEIEQQQEKLLAEKSVAKPAAPIPQDTAVVPATQASPSAIASNFIKVDAGKLDEIINLIGEVGIIQAHLLDIIKEYKIENTELNSSVERMFNLTDTLRELSLQLRMLPIKEIFSKYSRIVRDVATKTKKQIKLQIDGADTELDKSIMEKINEPLLHLVRNACDHGIDSPENRVSLGKPSCGVVKLQASQENSEVVIKTIDDGAGINIDKIKEKAIKAGLLKEGSHLSKQEILSYIFEPGFSTADEISDLSGRGVGMDVVKREVSKLHGSIQIDSKQNEGTTIAIRLPLTLAIINGLLIKISNFPCVIPMWNVIECVEISFDDYHFIVKNNHINFREKILPCIVLSKVLGVPGAQKAVTTMVVVQYAEHKVGIIVDNLAGEIQTVIKPIPDLFCDIKWTNGATILGSGEVAVILDIPGLISNLMEDRKDLMEVNI
jgi:two-component system chemotaxis sensor kinase CheA